jgi:4-amino-4-deoxy-L-arabinose transferase-like glycosyltransferase
MRMGLTASQGWWVAAIVATMPAVYAGSHNCFVDGVYAALILAAARIGFDAENIRE